MLGAEPLTYLHEATDTEHLPCANATGELLEATVRDLVVAAKRVLAAVRVEPTPSARAEAELKHARALLAAVGAALEARPEGLRVAEDGTWFETPAGRVDVQRRGAVRRILVALAERRVSAPSRSLGVDELFEIGWPGERIPYESQVRRVYTAIWTLRTLGLEEALRTRDDGYLLDPKHPVALAA
ncbi:MAG TPA: hypothetical protein VL400_01280 [Polyangiaceae bacterium]|jgi:hypothetical protein|nr:hypothetical protein [Polyangiaceae bacterium]